MDPFKVELTAHLKREEGCVLQAYQDHLGYWTIGIGRLIDGRKGGGITEEEAEFLLGNDIDKVRRKLNMAIPWWNGQPPEIRVALASMAFQMGAQGMLNFRKMLAALERGNREKAAEEALDSAWARQTPERARRVAAMIRGDAAAHAPVGE